MRKVAFIGGFDKADVVLYVAKTLVNMGKKVLLVDATTLQKTRYLIPTMKVLKQYITTFENVDIAIGFENLVQINEYRKETENLDKLDYDYILIDIDTYRAYYYYGIKPEDKHYFVTTFDLYSVRKGLQVFRKLETSVNVTKVYFTKEMDPSEDTFINFQSQGLKIKWDSNILYFPFETSDLNALFINQRSGKIQLKGVSSNYVDGISFIAEELSGAKESVVKKAIKLMEK